MHNIVQRKKLFLVPQNNSYRSYYPRVSSDISSWIDWGMEPMELQNFIRAFEDPFKGAQTTLNNKKVRIKSVHLQLADTGYHPFLSGQVFRKEKNWIVLFLSKGYALIVESVLDSNNKNIIKKIKEGDRFFTPKNFLDNAKKYRVKVNSSGTKV